MNIRWKKYIFKVNEIYGNSEEKAVFKKADIHAYFQQSKPVGFINRFTIHRQTLHLCIDLCKSEETLLKEMNQTTRYKVRRAERDNVKVAHVEKPNINDVKAFAHFYNSFAKAKGIKDCKLEKMIALMKNQMLLISYVYHEAGTPIAASATIANNGTAIGLYGASARFKHKDISGQFISRANRYLHWIEMIYFKRLGYQTFDLMGLTMNKSNTDHQKINGYKRGFGGEERVQYQSFIPQNMLGICLIWSLKLLWGNNPEIMKNEQSFIAKYAEGKKNQI